MAMSWVANMTTCNIARNGISLSLHNHDLPELQWMPAHKRLTAFIMNAYAHHQACLVPGKSIHINVSNTACTELSGTIHAPVHTVHEYAVAICCIAWLLSKQILLLMPPVVS